MLKIKLEGVDAEFEKLSRELSAETTRRIPEAVVPLLSELSRATPVDTGFAKSSWRFEKNEIVNKAPYIEDLNAGSSKQAPSFFVERTCLAHGKAVGAIVEIRPDP